MSGDDDESTLPSNDADAQVGESTEVRGRELARLLRRQAYRRAKELRAKDPKYLAMKELAKAKRREAGRAAREKRKAEQSVERAAEKKESSERRAKERARRDEELKKLLIRPLQGGPSIGGDAAGAAPPMPAGSKGGGDEPEEHSGIVLRVRAPRSEYDVN